MNNKDERTLMPTSVIKQKAFVIVNKVKQCFYFIIVSQICH